MCARTHSNTLRIIFPLAHGDVCLLNGQRQRSDAGRWEQKHCEVGKRSVF